MDIEQMALLIPILGILLGGGVAIIAILASHREKQKRVEARHRERLAAIERGIDIPPDPEPEAEVKKPSTLRSGLAGVFLGAVLYLALDRAINEDIALFGLIPAAFGIATLISFFVESRRPK